MKKVLKALTQKAWEKKKENNKGFTLIELIIVIAIIAILITLIAPSLMEFLETANKTKTDAAAKTLYTSAQTFVTKMYVAGTKVGDGTYTKGHASMKELEERYFNAEELASITDYTIIIEKGTVKSVKVTMDGVESSYPKTKTVEGDGK